ncbi:MAG: Gfo/Idh/MocA family protein [Phycisphaerales bacterium JB040]
MSTDPNPVRLAIIGAGGIAKAHASAATELSLPITAVADLNAESGARLAGEHGARSFTTSDELFAARDAGKAEFDAVVLCTPPTVRLDPIRAALERGVAVLAEKPLAANADEAGRIAELAAAHPDTLFAVAYCHRFAPAIVEMKRLVAGGRIGRLTRFENCFAFFHPPKGESWMSDPALSGGGSFIDTGCHSLDIFRDMVGPAELVGAVYDHEWPGRAESSATALVRATSGEHAGVGGVILAGWMEPTRFTVTLVGTGGTLHYDYMNAEVIRHTASDDTVNELPIETHEVRFREQLRAFAAGVNDPTARGSLATAEDGLGTAEVVEHAGQVTAGKII